MILTGAKLEEIGKALYGEIWVSVLSRKLGRCKRTIMRMRDEDGPLPLDLRRHMMDLIDEQFAILAEKRDMLAAVFDDMA